MDAGVAGRSDFHPRYFWADGWVDVCDDDRVCDGFDRVCDVLRIVFFEFLPSMKGVTNYI
jgi:hypothetical protein